MASHNSTKNLVLFSLRLQWNGHVKKRLTPNPSLNADVPHAVAEPTGGPPVRLFR